MGTFEHNGAQMYYEIHGEGEPLLLIAGLASDSQSWLSVLPLLSGKYRVIVYDNRTTGRTASHDDSLTVQVMAKDALALLDHLGIDKAIVVGHSMGGQIALTLAATNPERVSCLIIAGTPLEISARNKMLFGNLSQSIKTYGPTREWFQNLFFWIFTPTFFEQKALVSLALDSSVDYPYPQTPKGFCLQVDAAESFQAESFCENVLCPTLVIAGSQDIIFPVDCCKALAEAIPNAQFRIIEQAAHSIHSEKPAEFVQLVQEFITQR